MSQPDLPTFSIDEIPFSYCGSWLNLSPIVGLHRRVDDVHLVSHVTTMAPVLSLIPYREGRRAACRVEGTPSQLTWTDLAGDATVSATFDGPDTVRLRGKTLQLAIAAASAELTPFTGLFSVEDTTSNAVVFTMYETGRRYRVTVVRGDFDVVGAQQLAIAERCVLISAGATGDWEVAIEQFETAQAAYNPRDSFNDVVDRVEQEFRTYLDAVASWRTEETEAAALAAYILWSATVAPAGFVQREAVLMSKHWMDSVWSWDHCFNARALVGLPDLAWGQMLVPFDHQESFGALPDSVAHSRVLYNFVKPPIHGWMFTELLAAGLPAPSGLELLEWYERLSRWTRFWLEHRRLPGHRLPFYQHGNDSGWDNSTAFDAERWIETADLAAFLVLQLECLATLAVELDQTEAALLWRREADVISAAMLEELWDEGTQRFVVRGARSWRRPPLTEPADGAANRARPSPATRSPSCAQAGRTGVFDRVRAGDRAGRFLPLRGRRLLARSDLGAIELHCRGRSAAVGRGRIG